MTESLFTSQTPVVTDANDAGSGITRGTTVQFAVSGTVTGIRWWCPVTNTGNVQVRIYQLSGNASGSLLATKAVSGTPTGGAWNVTTFDTPVAVDASHVYRVTIFNSEGRYVATNSFFVTPLVVGNLTAEANNATPSGVAFSINQGTFQIGASDALPSSVGVAASYFVDVVFQAGGGGGTDLPVSGTLSGTGSISGALSATIPAVGSLAGHGVITGVVSGGDVSSQDGAKYEIEQIMEAIAALFDGIETGDEVGGVPITLECHAEVVAEVQPPSVVLELDDLTWDLNMGHGADGFTIAALALVTYQDMDNAQRALWRFLSRKNVNGVTRLKKVLEDDQTLGGLVSYAILTTVRNIGIITYAGVDYLGAEMIIEVIS